MRSKTGKMGSITGKIHNQDWVQGPGTRKTVNQKTMAHFEETVTDFDKTVTRFDKTVTKFEKP